MKIKKLTASEGFTIVELMIALSVLSLILLMVAVIMTQIGSTYSKGVNATSLQNSARGIQDDVSSVIRFSGFTPYPGGPTTEGGLTVYAYCIGNVRYSYVLNKELGYDSYTKATTNHVIWRDNIPPTTGSSCTPISGFNNAGSLDNGGYEMAAPHTRLTGFSISSSSPYIITVDMAYGDTDLLNLNGANTTCKGDEGQQFCAVSNLTTSAIQRTTTN